MTIKLLKLSSLFAAALIAGGCGIEPVEIYATNDPKITYEVLFVRHGCEVGRFKSDAGALSPIVSVCPPPGAESDNKPPREIVNPGVNYKPLHTKFGCEIGVIDGPTYITICPDTGESSTVHLRNRGKMGSQLIKIPQMRNH